MLSSQSAIQQNTDTGRRKFRHFISLSEELDLVTRTNSLLKTRPCRAISSHFIKINAISLKSIHASPGGCIQALFVAIRDEGTIFSKPMSNMQMELRIYFNSNPALLPNSSI
jgi:hypothetical protein